MQQHRWAQRWGCKGSPVLRTAGVPAPAIPWEDEEEEERRRRKDGSGSPLSPSLGAVPGPCSAGKGARGAGLYFGAAGGRAGPAGAGLWQMIDNKRGEVKKKIEKKKRKRASAGEGSECEGVGG